MPKIPTRPDRPSLIRLASVLPQGTEERKGILRTIKSYDQWMGRWLEDQAKDARFSFRNTALKDLWEDMFTGQISDGMWENTRNTGWEFWVSIPTSVGSKTVLRGQVPGGIKQTFGFNQLIPIVGDEMLEIIQKTEPEATMETVHLYTKEIMAALKAARKGVEPPDAPSTTPAPGAGLPDEVQQAQIRAMALKAIQDVAELDGRPEGEAFMYNTVGRRAGKYHYFVILRGREGYQALSAYGAVGKKPKAVPLTRKTWDRQLAFKAIMSKAQGKLSSGYRETPLEGVRQTLRLL